MSQILFLVVGVVLSAEAAGVVLGFLDLSGVCASSSSQIDAICVLEVRKAKGSRTRAPKRLLTEASSEIGLEWSLAVVSLEGLM